VDDAFDGVEWDKNKSDWNVEHRGFGFEIAAEVFIGDHLESELPSRESGEVRLIAIGSVDDRIVTVIWTLRGSNRRIISARLASKKERRIYRAFREKEAF